MISFKFNQGFFNANRRKLRLMFDVLGKVNGTLKYIHSIYRDTLGTSDIARTQVMLPEKVDGLSSQIRLIPHGWGSRYRLQSCKSSGLVMVFR